MSGKTIEPQGQARRAMLKAMANWDAAVARHGGSRVESQGFNGERKAPCAFAMSVLVAGAVGELDPSKKLDFERLLSPDVAAFQDEKKTKVENCGLAIGAVEGRVSGFTERARSVGAFRTGNDGYVPMAGDMLATYGSPGHINLITKVVELSPGRWEVTYRDNPTMYSNAMEKRSILRATSNGKGYYVETSERVNRSTGAVLGVNTIAPTKGSQIYVIDMEKMFENSKVRSVSMGTPAASQPVVDDKSAPPPRPTTPPPPPITPVVADDKAPSQQPPTVAPAPTAPAPETQSPNRESVKLAYKLAETTGRAGRPLLVDGEIPGAVEAIQRRLIALGHNIGTYGASRDGVDGKIGRKTLAALEAEIAKQMAAGKTREQAITELATEIPATAAPQSPAAAALAGWPLIAAPFTSTPIAFAGSLLQSAPMPAPTATPTVTPATPPPKAPTPAPEHAPVVVAPQAPANPVSAKTTPPRDDKSGDKNTQNVTISSMRPGTRPAPVGSLPSQVEQAFRLGIVETYKIERCSPSTSLSFDASGKPVISGTESMKSSEKILAKPTPTHLGVYVDTGNSYSNCLGMNVKMSELKPGQTVDDAVRRLAMSAEEAIGLKRQQFMDMKYDKLPPELIPQMMMFHTHQGGRAVNVLAQAIGQQPGKPGRALDDALIQQVWNFYNAHGGKNGGGQAIVKAFEQAQKDYYQDRAKTSSIFAQYLTGFTNRAAMSARTGMQMVAMVSASGIGSGAANPAPPITLAAASNQLQNSGVTVTPANSSSALPVIPAIAQAPSNAIG